MESEVSMEKLIHANESYRIRGAIFEVHDVLGYGFLESVYQECLCREFKVRGIPFREQPALAIQYKRHIISHTFKPDFICFDKVIVELKAVNSLLNEHRAQLRNYLATCGLHLGLLVNFGHYPGVQIERIVQTGYTRPASPLPLSLLRSLF